MISDAALRVGDPTVPDWLAAIGTVCTLFLGLVLLWRDSGERRRQRQWERGAQGRSVRIGHFKTRGQGTVDIDGSIPVFYEVALLNESDDAVHDVKLWLCVLPSRVVLGGMKQPGSGLLQPAQEGAFADVLAAHESLELRAAPKIAWDERIGGPAKHIVFARAEFRDMAGQLWERDDSHRLNLLRGAPKESWLADRWEWFSLEVAVIFDRLRRLIRDLF